MCGIAGLFAWDVGYRATRETLERLSTCIAHRGPDGQGILLSHEGDPSADRPQAGFVHRRLAILDPEPRADQPFVDLDGRWLIFNGEIYNFRELRKELALLRTDYIWRTTGDTEVLLLAYATWAENCLERLNGMFAFAIYTPARDGKPAELFLARDRMGQKPLYFAQSIGAIAFASEIGALRTVPWVDQSIDPGAIVDYLTRGFVSRGTMYRGIDKLFPGTWRRVTARRMEQGGRYFDPNGGSAVAMPRSQAVDETRRLVAQAVQRQLVSDVPLGVLLSGGIDSSIVAAAAAKAVGKNQRLLTFSIGFEDSRYDETAYAHRVAEHLGTQHYQFTVRPDAAADLPKLAAAFGQPFADSSALPTHYLARETRQHVKVALSGDGADELFGGYDRYRAMDISRRLPRVLRKVGALAGRLRVPASHPKSRLVRLQRFAHSLDLPAGPRYASYLRLFNQADLHELLNPDLRERAETGDRILVELYNSLMRGAPPRDEVQAALAVDRVVYLPDDLLTKVDHSAMLHALEVRSPYMDHELVQFAAGLPTEYLLRPKSKALLRGAFAAELPEGLFDRLKMGFAVPIGEWFRGDLRSLLRDSLDADGSFARTHFHAEAIDDMLEEHESRQRDHSQRLYALLMLELWHKTQ